MSRIRTIKPGMATSETLAQIPRETLCTWIMLWPQCDDYGHHLADPRLVWAAIYPLRADTTSQDVAVDLQVLEDHSKICRYTGCDGKRYLHILGWQEHQRVDNAAKGWLPACPVHEPHLGCWVHKDSCPGVTAVAKVPPAPTVDRTNSEFAASRGESRRTQ